LNPLDYCLNHWGPTAFLGTVFLVVTVVALFIDLAVLSRIQERISMKAALYQSIGWVCLALAFGGLLWYSEGHGAFVEYITAYTMEYSLSMDNIFVFILLFGFFAIQEKNIPKVLFYGILIAVLLRVIFIFVGVALVEQFEWVLYIFGAVLVYTGLKILWEKEGESADPSRNFLYRMLSKSLNIEQSQASGKLIVRRNRKNYFTILFLAVVVIGSTDLIFAIDSIPAAFGITRDRMIIMTSNIFAVLGLRAMFFMLRGAVQKFHLLQQGISLVLLFIGLKMLGGMVHIKIPNLISLAVILVVLGLSVGLSFVIKEKNRH